MRVTMKMIAEQLNLSAATVSRALNDKTDISIPEKTRRLIKETATKNGYMPNQIARALVSGNTHSIALSTYGFSYFNHHYTHVLNHLKEILWKDGYRIQVIDNREFARGGFSLVDGFFAFDVPVSKTKGFAPVGMPVISMGAYVNHDSDYVLVDLHGGSRKALEYLVQTGRRRVVMMLTAGELNWTDARCLAYREIMQKIDVPEEVLEVPWILPSEHRESARITAVEYIKKNGAPDAFFCYNDEVAIGVCRGLLESGVKIPTDTAVIGCDGLPDLEYFTPSISTIVQPVEDMCRKAWELMQKRLEDPLYPQQKAVLESRFVNRESSK